VAVTFDRHPNEIVAPAHVPPLIYPLSKKLEVLAALGVAATYVIRFDKEFSEISGQAFIGGLARDFQRLQSVCVGESFQFGAKRSGNVALLRQWGQELGFTVQALPDVVRGGAPVSSTRTRDAIRAGDFALAGEMLGRPYSLRGVVRQGEGLGRQLGFPTANLEISGLVLPSAGVYVAEARIEANCFRAAVNIGRRPTVASPGADLRVEAHLLDFARDIYGQELDLTFLKKLRDERKFPSRAALQAQIAADISQARQ
jgi:riboflavin kinase/FMN adenylyltransferase